MHVSNTISSELLTHLFKMVADGAIVEDDVKAFVQNPQRWRENHSFIPVETAHTFWQGVWDELLGKGKVQVPLINRVTKNQRKALARYGFLLVYLPRIIEDEYPACFVKLDWSRVHVDWELKRYMERLDALQRNMGKWVAIETLRKPNMAENGHAGDRLMESLGISSRFSFGSEEYWIRLHQHEAHEEEYQVKSGLLEQASGMLGFPDHLVRCPDALEWNMLGNLFNWLHEHRSMKHLPDLGSTDTWEMVGTPNSYSKEFFHAGGSKSGGLAGLARGKWWNKHGHDVAFRILIDL